MDIGREAGGRPSSSVRFVPGSLSCLQARHFKEMLTTANHLKQVKKIKIKADQLIGLRESYDVSISITKECTSLTVSRHQDRSVATESRLRQSMNWLVTIYREVLYRMMTSIQNAFVTS